jgi:hypothetical protein
MIFFGRPLSTFPDHALVWTPNEGRPDDPPQTREIFSDSKILQLSKAAIARMKTP